MQTITLEDQTIPVYGTILNTGLQQFHEEFIDHVFTIYAQEAVRNRRVTRELVKDRYDVDVPASTLQRWITAGNWETKAMSLYQTLRPGYINESMDNIMLGAKEGSSVLRDMATGKIQTDMNRAKVIFGLMDRAGLMPHSAVAEHIRLRMNEGPQSAAASMTDEELMQLEASYQPEGTVLPSIDIPDAQVRLASARRSPKS